MLQADFVLGEYGCVCWSRKSGHKNWGTMKTLEEEDVD
jgi:hypothetical protein